MKFESLLSVTKRKTVVVCILKFLKAPDFRLKFLRESFGTSTFIGERVVFSFRCLATRKFCRPRGNIARFGSKFRDKLKIRHLTLSLGKNACCLIIYVLSVFITGNSLLCFLSQREYVADARLLTQERQSDFKLCF